MVEASSESHARALTGTFLNSASKLLLGTFSGLFTTFKHPVSRQSEGKQAAPLVLGCRFEVAARGEVICTSWKIMKL